MIPNVVRGDRMAGLLVYLAGPGRHNEHGEPHMVAGDGALMAWYRDVELDRGSALAIARHLDRPRKLFGTEILAGIYERRQTGRGSAGEPVYQRVRVGSKPAHVWHCSLSLRADEGELSDEKWGRIAEDFYRAMGFDDHEGTKAPCRWAAVRHGVSLDGNDHIHLAVSLVREDGTKATTHKDFQRAQEAARALEIVHGLERLESATSTEPGASRGFTPGEQRRAEREAERVARAREEQRNGVGSWGQLDPETRRSRVAHEWRVNLPRVVLARTVRGCATAAVDEAEFVRRMRRAGLLVRPRFAAATQDVITGYSVAQRPRIAGERPVWYGGGRLGRDLTLPRLRGDWPDTAEASTAAAEEWYAAYCGRRIVRPGREVAEPSPRLWQEYAHDLDVLQRQLRDVPLDDRDTWLQVARNTAGVLSAWSTSSEVAPGHLATAADALSRAVQTYRRPAPTPPRLQPAFAGAALLAAAAVRLGRGPVGQAALLFQLMELSRSVVGLVESTHQARQASDLRRAVEHNLQRVHARLVAAETTPAGLPAPTPPRASVDLSGVDPAVRAAVERVRAGHAAPPSRSPLPAPLDHLERRRIPAAAPTEPDRGPDR